MTGRAAPLDLLVVGAGPAGLMAALQAARSGLSAAVVERSRPGGSVWHARTMENVPGFPDGISGPELARRIVAQAERFGVRVERDEVAEVDVSWPPLLGVRGATRSWSARAVLLATGARPVALGVPGEEALAGVRVFHHADEAPDALRTGEWCVAGGGDVAFDQALALAATARQVRILVRGDEPKAVARLADEASGRGILVVRGCAVTGVAEDGGRLVVECRGPDGSTRIAADGLLVCVGKRPDVSLVPPGLVGPDSAVICDHVGRTAVPGLFVAGDVRRGLGRQVAIASGDGLAVAMELARR